MHGLNLYDYSARQMEPALGRFTTMDPMCEKYYDWSPYAYVVNNPINAIDPDAKVVVFINGMHAGSGGTNNYWNGFDNSVMRHLRDNKALYYDGAMGGANATWETFRDSKIFGPRVSKNTNANDRYNSGYGAGRRSSRSILENLEDKETIKIISHSMGGAYAKGFVQALLDNGVELSQILFEADFAPYQPTQQRAIDGVRTLQFSHSKDWIAGNKSMEGAEYMDTSSDKKQGHGISSFKNQIKNLPRGNENEDKKDINSILQRFLMQNPNIKLFMY
jgi:uncharacterized protein RhaS with RHS repeats